MLYNEKALKGLLRSIGMERPLGYLIEGKGAEKIYGPLLNRDKGYEAVVEVIGGIVESPEFMVGDRIRKGTFLRFSPAEIKYFKEFYGVKRPSFIKSLIPKAIRKRKERKMKNVMTRAATILGEEYRPKIWQYVHEKLRDKN